MNILLIAFTVVALIILVWHVSFMKRSNRSANSEYVSDTGINWLNDEHGQGMVEFIFILFVLAILVCVAAQFAEHPIVDISWFERLLNSGWNTAQALATK